ncbi:MAG: tripartite tricarboxylate transporter substrate binding protein [Dysosmobacter sp.]|nr:tripartite tricarboxylate transporter substrate binding protein [Dysosmobacter sp.]
MKKLLAFVLALTMAATLAACGTSGSSTSNSGAASAAVSNAAGSSAASAAPEGYTPPKNVNLIVPYSAGGANDLLARLVAKHAAKYTDSNLVVTNIGGGSGTVGLAEVLKHDADGTYMCSGIGTTAFVSTPDKPLTFDYLNDFAFVGMFAQDQRVIVALKDNGKFTNLEEFVSYAKENPGELEVSATGAATVAYFVPQVLAEKAGIDITIVPYDGGSEQMADLLGGHSDAASISYSEMLTLDTDQLIILGVANTERPEVLPDTPTFAEQGYDVVFTIPRGFAMKAGTAPEAIEYWSNIFEQIANDSEYIQESEGIGFPVVYKNSAEFTTIITDTQTAFDTMLNG